MTTQRAVEAAGHHHGTPDNFQVQCASNCWVTSRKYMPLARARRRAVRASMTAEMQGRAQTSYGVKKYDL